MQICTILVCNQQNGAERKANSDFRKISYLLTQNTWFLTKPLHIMFLDLYKLCIQSDISVFQVKLSHVFKKKDEIYIYL